jgi:hypothetical protein
LLTLWAATFTSRPPDALDAVAVTEHTDPQAVYGSNLHRLAYKDDFDEFVKDGRELGEHYENKGRPEALQVQVRGEYAYVAAGKGGLRVYDIAQIDHKGFSERITTAPVSPSVKSFTLTQNSRPRSPRRRHWPSTQPAGVQL